MNIKKKKQQVTLPIANNNWKKDANIETNTTDLTLKQVRRQIAETVLLALLLMGLPMLVTNIINEIKLGSPVNLASYLGIIFKPAYLSYIIIVCLFIFRKKMPTILLTATGIILLLISGGQSMIDYGFIGSGMLFFMLACALGALFFDLWSALVPAIVSVVAISAGGLLWVYGYSTFNFDPAEYATSWNTYVVRMVTIFFFLVIIIGSIRRMNGFLTYTLRAKNRLNEDLHKNLAKYRQLIENINDIIYSLTAEGVFTFVSPAWTRLLGYAPEEVEGCSFTEFVHPDDLPVCLAFLNKVIETGERQGGVEYRVRHKNSEWRWHTSSVTPFKNAADLIDGFHGIARDITERKRIVEELRIFKESVENSTDAVGMSTPEGKHYYQNKAFNRLFGKIGENPPDTVYVDKKVGEEIFSTIMSGASWTGEVSMYGVDRQAKEVLLRAYANRDEKGDIINLVGIHTDITERKLAEQALRASEDFRKQVFESSRLPIVVMDANTYRYLDCNSAAVKIYAYTSKEQVLGLTPLDVSAPVQYDGTLSEKKANYYIDKAVSEGSVVFEWKHQRSDGSIWDAEVHLLSFSIGEKSLLQFSLLDITERKRAEEELRLKDRALASSANAVIMNTLDGRTIYFNEAFLSMYGYTSQEADQLTAYDLAYTAEGNQRVFTALQTKGFFISEDVAKHKDGSPFPVAISASTITNIHGQPVATMGSFIDITERKRAEESLKESEELYRIVVQGANDGIAIIQNSVHVFVNAQFLTMFGYESYDEISELPSYFTVHQDDREWVRGIASARQRGEDLPKKYEFKGIKKDGTIIYIEVSVNIITYKGERALLVFLRDVTERKRTEEALAKSTKTYKELSIMLESLFNAIPDILGIQDTQHNVIRYNQAGYNFLGCTQQEVEGKKCFELINKTKPCEVCATSEVYITKRKAQVEKYIEETGVWLECRSYPVFSEDGKLERVIEHLRDISERKRAEEELHASEERFKSFMNETPVYAYIKDDSLSHIYQNPRVSELGRGQLSEGKPDSARTIFDAKTADLLETSDKKILSGECETLDLEYMMTTKGEQRWLSDHKFAIEVPGKKRMVGGLAFDITDRKIAEEMIKKRLILLEYAATHTLEEILQKTLDEVGELSNSPIGFYHFVEKDQKTLLLQAWSTRTINEFCKAEGKGLHYSIDKAGVWVDCMREKRPVIHNDYSSLPHRKGLPEGHAPVIRELVVPVTREGDVVAIVGVGNKSSNYTEKDMELVTFFADVTWEITERKRAEEALRRSQQLFSTIFRANPAAVILSSIADGKCVDANEAYARVTGYAREELIGKTTVELNIWTSVEERQHVVTELAEKGHLENVELILRRKNGEWINTIAGGEVITLGGQRYILSFFVDITERKQAEVALKTSEKLLAAKNKELEQILYVASHDLRSPLVNVEGFSRELEYSLKAIGDTFENREKDHLKLDKLLREEFSDMGKALERIRASTRQMDGLLKGLLKLSRAGRTVIKVTSIDMNELIRQISASFSFRIKEAGIELTVEKLPECMGDVMQLTQVFSNLFDNAVKYLDKNRMGKVRITGSIQNGHAVYCVEDNGIGISDNHREKIFELFHRLNPGESEGEGLGLTIARQALGRLDGQINVESKPGKGSVFIVSLPSVSGRRNKSISMNGEKI